MGAEKVPTVIQSKRVIVCILGPDDKNAKMAIRREPSTLAQAIVSTPRRGRFLPAAAWMKAPRRGRKIRRRR